MKIRLLPTCSSLACVQLPPPLRKYRRRDFSPILALAEGRGRCTLYRQVGTATGFHGRGRMNSWQFPPERDWVNNETKCPRNRTFAIYNTAAKRLRMRQDEHFRSLFQSHFPVRSKSPARVRIHSVCSLWFSSSASCCSCFDYFVVIEIAFMDNQAQITETISRLDSEKVRW